MDSTAKRQSSEWTRNEAEGPLVTWKRGPFRTFIITDHDHIVTSHAGVGLDLDTVLRREVNERNHYQTEPDPDTGNGYDPCVWSGDRIVAIIHASDTDFVTVTRLDRADD